MVLVPAVEYGTYLTIYERFTKVIHKYLLSL
jgi:hypothetical protein